MRQLGQTYQIITVKQQAPTIFILKLLIRCKEAFPEMMNNTV